MIKQTLSILHRELMCYGKIVKPRKIRNSFWKNGKIIIIIINYHNGSRKLGKFSRSHITKRTSPLDLSREI